jgi:hypothetical protein
MFKKVINYDVYLSTSYRLSATAADTTRLLNEIKRANPSLVHVGCIPAAGKEP